MVLVRHGRGVARGSGSGGSGDEVGRIPFVVRGGIGGTRGVHSAVRDVVSCRARALAGVVRVRRIAPGVVVRVRRARPGSGGADVGVISPLVDAPGVLGGRDVLVKGRSVELHERMRHGVGRSDVARGPYLRVSGSSPDGDVLRGNPALGAGRVGGGRGGSDSGPLHGNSDGLSGGRENIGEGLSDGVGRSGNEGGERGYGTGGVRVRSGKDAERARPSFGSASGRQRYRRRLIGRHGRSMGDGLPAEIAGLREARGSVRFVPFVTGGYRPGLGAVGRERAVGTEEVLREVFGSVQERGVGLGSGYGVAVVRRGKGVSVHGRGGTVRGGSDDARHFRRVGSLVGGFVGPASVIAREFHSGRTGLPVRNGFRRPEGLGRAVHGRTARSAGGSRNH